MFDTKVAILVLEDLAVWQKRFVMRNPIGAVLSMSAARAIPVSRSLSSGTISLTRPMRNARSAPMKRPVSKNSAALERPTRRGSR